MIIDLLKIHPSDRKSAEECLKSPIFDKMRNLENEAPANKRVKFEFDNVETLTDLHLAFMKEYFTVKKQSKVTKI